MEAKEGLLSLILSLSPSPLSLSLPAPPHSASHISVPICVGLFARLPRDLLLASLHPRRRDTLTPKLRSEVGRVPGVRREPLPSAPFRRAAGAPAVTPPRRADGAGEDPGGQISLPFDRSFPIRSGFPLPLPTALPRSRGSRAPRAGSGLAGPSRRRQTGLPLRCVPAASPPDFGRSSAERGKGGRAQALPRGALPTAASCRQRAVPVLSPSRRRWGKLVLNSSVSVSVSVSVSLSLSRFSFLISHTHAKIRVFVLRKSDFCGTPLYRCRI